MMIDEPKHFRARTQNGFDLLIDWKFLAGVWKQRQNFFRQIYDKHGGNHPLASSCENLFAILKKPRTTQVGAAHTAQHK